MSARLCASLAWLFATKAVFAQELPPCSAEKGRDALIRCALDRSPELRQAHLRLEALSGRRRAAGVWLPNLPALTLTAASRRPPQGSTGSTAFNWTATLSQELEVAGKRGLRLDAVDAELAAEVKRLAVTEQTVASSVFAAYFRLLAAHQALDLAKEFAASAEALKRLSEGREREQLISQVDATVASAEAARLAAVAIEGRRRLADAEAELVAIAGLDPDLPIEVGAPDWSLPQPRTGDPARIVEEALRLRGEVTAARAEADTAQRQVALLRRQRLPNVTLSAFAQRDGFDEQVLGGGLALPLPLPSPVWPSRRGELEEARASVRAAEAKVEGTRRQIRREVAEALAEDRARDEAARLFDQGNLNRARKQLGALSQALSLGQLSLREALLLQRSLIEFLQAGVEAELNHALARIELLRASGQRLLGDAS